MGLSLALTLQTSTHWWQIYTCPTCSSPLQMYPNSKIPSSLVALLLWATSNTMAQQAKEKGKASKTILWTIIGHLRTQASTLVAQLRKLHPTGLAKLMVTGKESPKEQRKITTGKTKSPSRQGPGTRKKRSHPLPKERGRSVYQSSARRIIKSREHTWACNMLQSVQVFHALGKKPRKKTRMSSFRVVQNTGSIAELRPHPAITWQLDISHDRKVAPRAQRALLERSVRFHASTTTPHQGSSN